MPNKKNYASWRKRFEKVGYDLDYAITLDGQPIGSTLSTYDSGIILTWLPGALEDILTILRLHDTEEIGA